MKIRLKCNLYKCLFRVLFVPSWRVFLMDKHLNSCPFCGEEVVSDEMAEEMLVTPGKAKKLPGIWTDLHNQLEDSITPSANEKSLKIRWSLVFFRSWQWKGAALGFLLLILAILPFTSGKKQSISRISLPENEVGMADKIVLKSIKIGRKDAKYYFFKSKDPDKVIVWAENK